MRRTLTATGLALVIAATTAAPATAGVVTAGGHWRITYVSRDTGYDDFGLYSVAAVGRHDAWAVGSRRKGAGAGGAVLHWDGSRWHDVELPGSTGSFQSVGGSSPTDVWVLGVNATGADTAWHWNGSEWSFISIAGYRAGGVAVLSATDAWAVGGDASGDDGPANALHWDGSTWQKVRMPHTAFKVGAVAKNDVWAVGEGNADQPYAAHWNGTKWTSSALPKVPLPKGTTGFSYFNDVAALSKTNVWAVGRLYYRVPGKAGHNRPVLMHWNGTKWSLTLDPTGDFAMSVTSDGAGGLWYSGFNGKYVHRTASGRTTTYKVPAPENRPSVDVRSIAGVRGGKVLAVGQVQPAPGGDESWDALVEEYAAGPSKEQIVKKPHFG